MPPELSLKLYDTEGQVVGTIVTNTYPVWLLRHPIYSAIYSFIYDGNLPSFSCTLEFESEDCTGKKYAHCFHVRTGSNNLPSFGLQGLWLGVIRVPCSSLVSKELGISSLSRERDTRIKSRIVNGSCKKLSSSDYFAPYHYTDFTIEDAIFPYTLAPGWKIAP